MSSKKLDLNADGEFTTPKPEMIELGNEIKAIYYDILSDKYEIYQRPSKKNDWIWYRAAELATASELTAMEFVTRQVEEMAKVSVFWPTGLMSAKLSTQASCNEDKYNKLQLAKYKAQINQCCALEKLYGMRVYSDPSLAFGPVVQTIMAIKHKDTKHVEKLREAVERESSQYWVAKDLIKAALLCRV